MLYNWLNHLALKNLLVLVLTLFVAFIYLTNHTIINNNLLSQSFGDQIPVEKINLLLEKRTTYEWAGYLLIVIIAVIKYLVIAGIIQGGMLIYSIEVRFSKILKIVIIAEFIFLIPILIKILWFTFVVPTYDLKELSFFTPLSMLNLFTAGSISSLWVYPLSLINVFDICYIFMLAYGVKKIVNISYDNSLKIIVGSYVPGLFLWVVFVLFVNVMTSPLQA
jgi:hypothetical protein